MAQQKEAKAEVKAKDFTDFVKSLSEVVRESQLAGLDLASSLWEENLKALNTQVEYWTSVRQDYTRQAKEFSEKFPKEVVSFWEDNSRTLNAHIERVLNFQQSYVESVRKSYDKFARDAFDLTQKNFDRGFSLFADYLNLLGS